MACKSSQHTERCSWTQEVCSAVLLRQPAVILKKEAPCTREAHKTNSCAVRGWVRNGRSPPKKPYFLSGFSVTGTMAYAATAYLTKWLAVSSSSRSTAAKLPAAANNIWHAGAFFVCMSCRAKQVDIVACSFYQLRTYNAQQSSILTSTLIELTKKGPPAACLVFCMLIRQTPNTGSFERGNNGHNSCRQSNTQDRRSWDPACS